MDGCGGLGVRRQEIGFLFGGAFFLLLGGEALADCYYWLEVCRDGRVEGLVGGGVMVGGNWGKRGEGEELVSGWRFW